MADFVEREQFFEGQVLAAAQLNGTVEQPRAALARHHRYQHVPGIVTGLELSDSPRQAADGSPYAEVTVAAGLAVDRSGRAIVVTEETRLSESLFDQLNVAVADPEALYPVLLIGRDQEAGPGDAPGSCEAAGAARIAEAWQLTFTRPGGDPEGDDPRTLEVGDGPGGELGGENWPVLLGFVRWDSNLRKFLSSAATAEGVSRRHAGVRAGSVEALGGRLVLRGGPANEDGVPAVALDAEDKVLHFGPQDATGAVTPVMTVDTDGNLSVEGKITGVQAGALQAESGLITDGLKPAPGREGQVVHYSVAFHYTDPPAALGAPPVGERWLAHPLEVRVVDGRVRCSVLWRLTGGSIETELPGICQYTVLFHTPEGEGGS